MTWEGRLLAMIFVLQFLAMTREVDLLVMKCLARLVTICMVLREKMCVARLLAMTFMALLEMLCMVLLEMFCEFLLLAMTCGAHRLAMIYGVQQRDCQQTRVTEE
jgi:hypothetical protein